MRYLSASIREASEHVSGALEIGFVLQNSSTCSLASLMGWPWEDLLARWGAVCAISQ